MRHLPRRWRPVDGAWDTILHTVPSEGAGMNKAPPLHIHADSVEPAAMAPDVAMHFMLTRLFDDEGAVAMGYVVDGFLLGIYTAVSAKISRESAYAILQRHADTAALELAKHGP
jgi:hypothetical protein